MLRFIPYAAVVVFVFLAFDAGTHMLADENAEPALKYSVKVGDKTVMMAEGETATVEGTFNNPTIKFTAEPYRVFPYQGVTFNYPRSFGFQAELEDPDSKTWTLSGNDFIIMYFVINASLTAADFADNMMSQFGPENTKVVNENASITLGQQELSGTSIRISIAEHSLAVDIYRVPSAEGTTRLLVFQDSLDDSGNGSKEKADAMRLIKSSFGLKR